MEPGPSASSFAGCLVGQALGDALGFPVEGGSLVRLGEACHRVAVGA